MLIVERDLTDLAVLQDKEICSPYAVSCCLHVGYSEIDGIVSMEARSVGGVRPFLRQRTSSASLAGSCLAEVVTGRRPARCEALYFGRLHPVAGRTLTAFIAAPQLARVVAGVVSTANGNTPLGQSSP